MDLISKLTKLQILILILITGKASLTALNGLSQSYRDYYVSAAISMAFFEAVLMICLASPFLYLFRRKPKRERPLFQLPVFKMPEISWKRVSVAVVAICFVGLGIGFITFFFVSEEAPKENITATTCNQIKIENPQANVIHERFDPLTPPQGEKFYLSSADEEVWSEADFDVDADGLPEKILTAKVAMNHTPHVVKIVKDGFVIFQYEGAGVNAQQVEGNNGFILMETLDWDKDIRKRTRLNFENGKFIPVWYEEGCNG